MKSIVESVKTVDRPIKVLQFLFPEGKTLSQNIRPPQLQI